MKKFKLFFLRNKEKFFRFLAVFMSCIVLSFSVFSFNSFATGSSNVYYSSIAQPQISSNTCYLEVITSNGGQWVLQCVAFGRTRGSSVSVRFKATISSGGSIYISVLPDLMDLEGSDLTYPICVSGVFTDIRDNTTRVLGTITDTSVQNGYFAGLYFGSGVTISKIHGYNCDTSSVTSNGDFTFVYGSDTVLNQKMDIINNTLSSIDTNTDLTADRLNTLISEVIETNANLEQIQSIIQNEGVLTRQKLDSIISYLEAAENGAYYNPSDDGTSSTVNNQQQKDDEVMQGTSSGRTEANNTISGLSGLLTTTGAVFKGSTAMTKVFNLFAQSAFLAPILQISLVLGISSFVLGTAFIVVGRIRNKKE